MKPEALLRKKQRRERDARRGRLGKGVFDALVRELAQTIRLAFEAGATGSLFGLEGSLRHGIRSDLCLQGWKWKDADAMARELMAMAFMVVRAVRPSWEEGQLEWTIHAGTLVERTRCARCHKPLPEGHHKFCGDLCGKLHRDYAREMQVANEDRAIWLAVKSARSI